MLDGCPLPPNQREKFGWQNKRERPLSHQKLRGNNLAGKLQYHLLKCRRNVPGLRAGTFYKSASKVPNLILPDLGEIARETKIAKNLLKA